MDAKMLARIGAIMFVAVAVTATAVEMTRKDDATPSSATHSLQLDHDPLREGQRRCQQLGQKAAEEAECLRVWAQTRDRFLGRTPAPVSPSSAEGR